MTWHIKTLVWQKSSDRDQNAPKVPDFRTHLTSLKFRTLWNLLRKANLTGNSELLQLKSRSLRWPQIQAKNSKDMIELQKRFIQMKHVLTPSQWYTSWFALSLAVFIPLIIVFAEVLKLSSNRTCYAARVDNDKNKL